MTLEAKATMLTMIGFYLGNSQVATIAIIITMTMVTMIAMEIK